MIHEYGRVGSFLWVDRRVSGSERDARAVRLLRTLSEQLTEVIDRV